MDGAFKTDNMAALMVATQKLDSIRFIAYATYEEEQLSAISNVYPSLSFIYVFVVATNQVYGRFTMKNVHVQKTSNRPLMKLPTEKYHPQLLFANWSSKRQYDGPDTSESDLGR